MEEIKVKGLDKTKKYFETPQYFVWLNKQDGI